MNIFACMFMIVCSAIVSTFAFIDLFTYGTPMMGVILFGCGACFVGGWVAIAVELDNGQT
jgi:hypothetical protein